MHIAFEIPKWLLYVVGIPAGLLVLLFAVFGVIVFWAFKDGIWR
jgi:hypothetical protein